MAWDQNAPPQSHIDTYRHSMHLADHPLSLRTPSCILEPPPASAGPRRASQSGTSLHVIPGRRKCTLFISVEEVQLKGGQISIPS